MIDIIVWVRDIEQLAYDVYTRGSDHFRQDPLFSDFLRKIAEDELWHGRAMDRALDYCTQAPRVSIDFSPAISVDDETDQRIRGAFQDALDKLKSAELTREFLIRTVIRTEFSEWNDLFSYVVNTLKTVIPEFVPAAAKFQGHKRTIEYFVEKNGFDGRMVSALQTLPPVWREKILIIEDEESIAELMQALLNREGEIDTAENGQDGLKKIQENYYKLILSDVDMPVMDGLTCYRQAVSLFPAIDQRYLFFTGNPAPETVAFFQKNGLPYLTKPSNIRDIRDRAMDILLAREASPRICPGRSS